MKVLLVFNNLSFGGAQRVLLDYLRVLKNYHSINVQVLTFSNGLKEVVDEVRLLGYNVIELPCIQHLGAPYIKKELLVGLSHKLKDVDIVWVGDLSLNVHDFKCLLKKPTVVHLHSYWYICPSFHMSFGLMRPCSGCSGFSVYIPYKLALCRALSAYTARKMTGVSTRAEQENPAFSSKNLTYYLNRLKEWTSAVPKQLAVADGLIAVSQGLKDIYVKAVQKLGLEITSQFIVLPNFTLIENTNFEEQDDIEYHKRLRILYAGGSVLIKGPHMLLKALSLLSSEELDQLTVDMVCSRGTWIEKLAMRYSLLKYIRFYLQLAHHEFLDLLRGSHVLIVPSIFPEPFSVLILEAQTLGIPVIASRIGGTPEIVIDKVTGLLVEPNNPHSLAEAIRFFLRDRNSVISMGYKAQTVMRHKFNPQEIVRRLVKFFEEQVN
jgi:glycosyltransferase involved in cell wall biosynthesis